MGLTTAGNLSFRNQHTPLSSHAAAVGDRPARYERATPRWARSVRAQPVTDLAPYDPVGSRRWGPYKQVRSLIDPGLIAVLSFPTGQRVSTVEP